jgi:hypothetical protein
VPAIDSTMGRCCFPLEANDLRMASAVKPSPVPAVRQREETSANRLSYTANPPTRTAGDRTSREQAEH